MSDGILIVCGHREFGEKLLSIVSTSVSGRHSIATTGAEARRRTEMTDFPSILLADKIPDENYLDLSIDLAENGCKGVIIIVDHNELYEAHSQTDGLGITILSKPLTKDALTQAILLILKVAEGGGIFDKAKLMLVQQKGWSESKAHRYIQKLSMDKRLARDITAQYIIKALKKEKSE